MENKPKQFVFKEATKKRCKIFDLDEKSAKRFTGISLELFNYLWEVNTIDFSIYFRVGQQMVEFIKPSEISKELLEQMWAATQKPEVDIEVCVLKADRPKFTNIIDQVRSKKLNQVKDADATLNHQVLDLFGDLSAASQMIVRGGIDREVVRVATASTSSMLNARVSTEDVVGTLSRMINCDATLYDHSASVAMLSGILAARYQKKSLVNDTSETVALCGLFHDAGKTCIPNSILNKPGKFTDSEYEVMKSHTVLGHQELQKVIQKGAPVEEVVARVALEHHERFTGKGYPHCRKGRLEDDPENGIHLYSRIVSIADVYSALLMKRVYKEAMSSEEAITLMRKFAPQDFDPELFAMFNEMVSDSINLYKDKEKKVADGRVVMIDEKDSFAAAVKQTKKAN